MARGKGQSCAIKHGVVVASGGGVVRVSFVAMSACSGCHAKGACGLSEAQDREVDIYTDSADYQVGDHVQVGLQDSKGLYAVVISYLVPFVLVVATIFALQGMGFSEGLSAVVGLLLLAPYYLSLYFLKGRISKSFSLTILRKE
ncbi:MAG: RseC/MucC family positive regulator of sigma(E) [Bacteroidia bacterium]|nr:MAG: RseC/MucC family positive regulator of sigma(E) [Bacteroidia bacterium]